MDGTTNVVSEIRMPGFVHADAVPGVSLEEVGRVDGSDEQRLMGKHLEELATRCNEICVTDGGHTFNVESWGAIAHIQVFC